MMSGFDVHFWLQLAIYVIGGVSGVVILAFKIGTLETKFVTKVTVEKCIADHECRYEGFKKFCHESFVRRDLCDQMHKYNKDEIEKVEERNHDFRIEIRNVVQKIYDRMDFQSEKIDELKELIIKGKGL
jgi:hypothetical protein